MNVTEYYMNVRQLFSKQQFEAVKEALADGRKAYGETFDYHFFTGVIAFNEERYDDAILSLTEADTIQSGDTRIYFNLGVSCVRLEQYSDAMKWFKKVLMILPEHIPTLIMVSAVFNVTGNPAASQKTCQIILRLDPNNVSALNNIGEAYKNSGMSNEAAEAYKLALRNNPTIDPIRSNYLFSLNYASIDPEVLRSEHENVTEIWDRPLFIHKNKPFTERKLRIGFVSPDFCHHSVAYFLTGLFTNLSHTYFFVVCYSNVNHEDTVTNWFKEKCDLWRDINFISKELVAQNVYDDAIDILIDLSGHTGGSNLPTFGLHPAPIQVTWLGYPTTTGLKSIKYRITDENADPEGTESHYTEQLIRLPHFLNYTPHTDIPEPDFSASRERDFVLFGSFNNIAKLSPETITLWAMVLQAVPNSKMLIKHKYFNDPTIQILFLKRFSDAGISEDRLIFHGLNFTDKGHLCEYHQIDIALDSWPYNGTTTTFEAMIMGVPTLTMSGSVHASRVGKTIMTGIGLPQFITETPEQFAQRAIELTTDREKLLAIKTTLRDRFYTSPFADAKGFTVSFEQVLTSIWKDHCEQNH